MVGRTPEFLGKKVEAKEMKIAMIIALLHPFLILVGTALATAFPNLTSSTLSNPGFHGFSQMLYEFTSSVPTMAVVLKVLEIIPLFGI
jgi:K+-transporting ATPase ATPase A chain